MQITVEFLTTRRSSFRLDIMVSFMHVIVSGLLFITTIYFIFKKVLFMKLDIQLRVLAVVNLVTTRVLMKIIAMNVKSNLEGILHCYHI
jgi:hypothetical protein